MPQQDTTTIVKAETDPIPVEDEDVWVIPSGYLKVKQEPVEIEEKPCEEGVSKHEKYKRDAELFLSVVKAQQIKLTLMVYQKL